MHSMLLSANHKYNPSSLFTRQSSMDLYEAHQRTNASIQRLIRSQKLPQACRICFCTCITLFEGHQWISAFDLSIKLVDLFERLHSCTSTLSYSIDEQIAMLCKICQVAAKAATDESQREILLSCGSSALSEFGNRAILWSINADWRYGNSELLLNLAVLAECMQNWNLVLEWGVYSVHRSIVNVLSRAVKRLEEEEGQKKLENVEKTLLKMKNVEFVRLLKSSKE